MRISIIIPVLDEAGRIGPLVRDLLTRNPIPEVLVIDGGSRDATVIEATFAGAHVLKAPRGRGQQLSIGAQAACGDVLLFLHADTRLGNGALSALRRALSDAAVSGGNFRILFDGDDRFSRRLEGLYAWSRRLGLYYGDSAIFVRRNVYDALGGMLPVELMEDFDFSRRLERYGGTICIVDPPVTSSSRRFQGRRPVSIVIVWLWIHLLYYLKVRPATLAGLYDSERRRRTIRT
ncbi:MAG: TIGR04283 family arsenosugar biosynthesis glycosyltransferase [Kiloniellales bacterium]